MQLFIRLLLTITGLLALWVPAIAANVKDMPDDAVHQLPEAAVGVRFDRDVLPILARYCLECHGPDAAKRKAGLRLDRRDGAVGTTDSGRPAIDPGKPDGSELIRRILASDADERMPPPETNQVLAPDEKDMLIRWIREGAPLQEHWAFTPIGDPEPPRVHDATWVRQPLDRFILAKLEAAGLKPAPRADRRTLIRRVYFDLIGLPPTKRDVEAFLDDNSPSALDRMVDRLLASPRYGERWGRHWLDVARYADSNGADENHAYPHAFRYRDYVIEAWNRDLPFDRFITEQLAGDRLPEPEDLETAVDWLTATGFLAIGTKILAEQDPVKKRADIVDEQLDTMGRAFMGLTLGCARCHDHKFDPIPTRDYYALAGILHSSEIEDRPLETADFLKEKADFDHKLSALQREAASSEGRLSQWIQEDSTIEWEAEAFARGNPVVDREQYGKEIGIVSDAGGGNTHVEYDLNLDRPGAYLLEIRYAAAKSRPGRVSVDGEVVLDGALAAVTGGWFPDHQRWIREGVLKFDKASVALRLESEPNMSHLDKVRLIPLRVDNEQALAETLERLEALRERIRETKANEPKPDQAMAVRDGEIRDIPIHRRGSHLDLGETVPRGFLSRVGPGGTTAVAGSGSSGRLDLARWMTSTENPLTARVIVNRIWRWHFGRGLSKATDNFGTKGEFPTHPELLDYLASRLMEADWSIKSMHRRILLSAIYQMASTGADAEGVRVDPENELYWRRDPKRLEAEVVRDTLLALSGRLDTAMGGMPIEVVAQNPSPKDLENNRKAYEGSPRRSVYLPVVRSNVYDLFTLFDFPNAATPVGDRSTTTVPTQALLLMNNDFVHTQIERIVQAVLRAQDADDEFEWIQALYSSLLGRRASEFECRAGAEFLAEHRRTRSPSPSEANAVDPSWVAFAHVLAMSNEFIYLK